MKKYFLFLVISCLIIFPTLPSLAEQWVRMRDLSSNRHEAIDLDSVKRQANLVYFWKILTFNGSNYRNGMLSYFVLDCQARTYKTLKTASRQNGQSREEVDLRGRTQTLPIQNYPLIIVAHRRFCSNSNN